jgi:hypothetical protein
MTAKKTNTIRPRKLALYNRLIATDPRIERKRRDDPVHV